MDNFFKVFDIYGSEFNLRINGQTKFRSGVGGLMSMITMGVFIWTVVSFGRDFYMRENPKITIGDGIYPEESIPVLNGSDYQEKYIVLQYEREYDKIIRPYLLFQKNSTESDYKYLSKCNVDYLVNKSIVLGEGDFNYHLFTYYCVRMNDFLLGRVSTSQNNKNSFPFIFAWDDCENITQDDSERFNLTTCEKNYNSSLNTLNLMVWYEKIGFSPNSKSPFVKKTAFTNYFLFNDRISIIHFPISLYELLDDVGWISNSIDPSYDFNFAQSSIIHHPEPVKNPRYPKANILVYISDNYRLFSRTYQKLQDLMATIGGFMKLVFTILSVFSTMIRLYLIDNYIVDKIFDNEVDPEKNKIPQRDWNLEATREGSARYRVLSNIRKDINNKNMSINICINYFSQLSIERKSKIKIR
jgi:hypothetical protein